MRFKDLIFMSLSNLFRRKIRTFLTTLGVVIGASSIILMIAIGIGYEEAFNKDLEMFGNIRIVNVQNPYRYSGAEEGGKASDRDPFDETLEEKFSGLDGVEGAMGIYELNLELSYKKYENWTQVYGVDLEKLKAFQIDLAEGDMPAEGATDLIVGQDFSYSFYNPRSNNYEEIYVEVLGNTFKGYVDQRYDNKGNMKKPKKFKVVGLLDESGEYNYAAFMDKHALLKLIEKDKKKYGDPKDRKKKQEYSRIMVLCKTIDDVEPITETLGDMGYEVYSPIESVLQQKKQMQSQQMLLGTIGAVSLLVAAIGIINTMIMSIYERTREIGVMKVLGAEISDILKMFLFEAAFIGFIGGIFGLGLSYLVSYLINNFGNLAMSGEEMGMGMMGMGMTKPVIPMWLAGLSIVFSIMVGTLAGLIPAIRATRLSALEAIKNE